MSARDFRQSEGVDGGVLDTSALLAATASELSLPLVLLRQLGFALSRNDISENERQRLGEQLTLTTERALRLAASLSMSSTNQTAFTLEPVNPVSICQQVVHELAPLFTAYGQKITLQQRSRVPMSVANRQLLQHVLLGFGDNALHYGSSAYPVHMTINSHKNWIRIGMRDYGPAVPIDLWQRLDGKVARHAKAPLATRPRASGVSLLAAKRLAEMMGSAVGIIRHRDGATFYIDLRLSNQMSLL